MDPRQTQIRERAGLEEGRYNQDFIDWLRKWGVPILFIFAVAAAGYGLRDRYKRAQDNKLDEAFSELELASASANPSPETFLQIAQTFDGKASVSTLARIDAADVYLDSARRGVRPGAALKADGELEKPEDALTADDRTNFLGKAGDLYQQAYDETHGDPGKRLLTISALYGVAAVSEGKQNLERAKSAYEEIANLAVAGGFLAHESVARDRLAKLQSLKDPAKVYSKAELPPVPEAPKPAMPTMTPVPPPGDIMFTTPDTGVTTPSDPMRTPAPAPDAPPQEEPGVPAAPQDPAPQPAQPPK